MPMALSATRAMAALGIITDMIIAGLPVWMLWDVRMKRMKKIPVMILISLSTL